MYVVKATPVPLTRTDGITVLYDVDRKTMYINMVPNSKKPHTMKLDVLSFASR